MTTVIPIHGNCNKEMGIQISSEWLQDFKKNRLVTQCETCGATCIIFKIASANNLEELENIIKEYPIDIPESPEKTF